MLIVRVIEIETVFYEFYILFPFSCSHVDFIDERAVISNEEIKRENCKPKIRVLFERTEMQ